MKKLFIFALMLCLALSFTVFAEDVSIDSADNIFAEYDFRNSADNEFAYSQSVAQYDAQNGYFNVFASGSVNFYFNNNTNDSKCIIEMEVTPTSVTSRMFVQPRVDDAIRDLGRIVNNTLYLKHDIAVCTIEANHTYNIKFIYDRNTGKGTVTAYDIASPTQVYSQSADCDFGTNISRCKLDFVCSDGGEFHMNTFNVYEKLLPTYYRTVKLSGANDLFVGDKLSVTAKNTGGTVNKVEFFLNGALAEEDNTAPYEYVCESVLEGTYELYAKTTFSDGIEYVSDKHYFTASKSFSQNLANTSQSITSKAEDNGDGNFQCNFLQIQKGSTGKISVDVEFSFSDMTSSKCVGELRGTNGSKILLNASTAGKMYFNSSNTIDYEADTVYSANMTIDTASNTYSGELRNANGDILLEEENIALGNLGDFNRIKLQQNRPTSGESTTLYSKIKIDREYCAPSILKLYADGVECSEIPAKTEMLSFNFSSALLRSDDIENEIRLVRETDGSEVECEITYSLTDNRVEIIPLKGFGENCTYRIYVSSQVKDDTGNSVAEGYYKTVQTKKDDLHFVKCLMLEDGKAVNKIPQNAVKIGLMPIIENNTLEDKNVCMIITSYDENGNMNYAESVDISIPSGGVYKDIEKEFNILSGTQNVSVYLWDGLRVQKPFSQYINLVK